MTRLCLVAALLAGCSAKPTAGGVKLQQADDALAAGGFKLDGFKPTDPGKLSAQKCTEGALEGVETLLCEYGSAEAVTLGKKAAEDWVAQATTGAVLTNGLTLLAVADRNRADPNGKTIHKITQAFSKAK